MSISAREIRILGQAGYSFEQIAVTAEAFDNGPARGVMFDLITKMQAHGADNAAIARALFQMGDDLNTGTAIVCQCRAHQQRYCRCAAFRAERWLK